MADSFRFAKNAIKVYSIGDPIISANHTPVPATIREKVLVPVHMERVSRRTVIEWLEWHATPTPDSAT